MLVASKVRMRGSEKKKMRTGTQAPIFFVSTSAKCFSIKRVTRKFHVATTTSKRCAKKCTARAKLFFATPIFFIYLFFWPFLLPTPFSITRFYVLFQ